MPPAPTTETRGPAPGREPEHDLVGTLGRLRRVLRRRVRRDWPHRPLTDSEVELLRLVQAAPGLRVQDAAAALGVAANTVSTLVRRLDRQGLLERGSDAADGRAARLALTPAAMRRMKAWRDRRRQILEGALRRVSAADRAAIERSVPALERLIDAVERS